MWHDIDSIRLVKKFYSCYMAIVVVIVIDSITYVGYTIYVIVNGRGLDIDTRIIDTNPLRVS